MSLFVLDTVGNNELLKSAPKIAKSAKLALLKQKPNVKATVEPIAINEDDNDADEQDYFGLPPPSVDLSKLIESTLQRTERPKTKVEEAMEHATDLVNTAAANAKPNPRLRHKRVMDIDYSDFNTLTGKFDEETTLHKVDVEKELEKSDLNGGIEKLKELPSITIKRQRQLARRERNKTKGAGWFNLPATEITEEVENDLKILQMRSVLDPKHFYKKNDLKVLPKYFQIGTVQHSPLDYYNERDTRRNKKKSLVDELMADAEVQKYTKRKYKETIAIRDKYAHRKAMKKMKKLKKNK